MGIHTYFKSLTKLERIERCPGEFMFERHTVASHSFKVAQYAQFLGTVEEQSGTPIDWKSLYEKAINHDYPEIFIGDIKTPVKYWTPELREMLSTVEEGMTAKFIDTEFPEEYKDIYRDKLKEGKDATVEGQILSAADKIDLIYEAFTEIQRGNAEPVFLDMYHDALIVLKHIKLHSVSYFINEVLPELMDEDIMSTIDIRKITEAALK
ncbi:HD domain-containing protein [Bacillus testis]|uniref:HD domain-containing protein n=1 Tax=Bacillus testis TaxID=1622072 RepID=UPI00067EBDF8|nr:HD domain-containing protein [Bacillus testis]